MASEREKQEKVELTNMCMLRREDGRYLVENRVDPGWPGIVFPGGHVERGESITASAVREVREETGITVLDPRLCGIKQFRAGDGWRYMVFLFKASRYEGELRSSGEGEAMWLTMDEIRASRCVPGFNETLKVFLSEEINEVVYFGVDGDDPEYL